jgi:hypothetical protein
MSPQEIVAAIGNLEAALAGANLIAEHFHRLNQWRC